MPARIACFAGPDADIAYNKANAGRTYTVVRPNGSKVIATITLDSNIDIGGGEGSRLSAATENLDAGCCGTQPSQEDHQRSPVPRQEPLWSADGSHILFGRMDYDGHKSLWLMEASGANAAQVCRVQVPDDFGDQDSWFGYYGYIDWRRGFDWRR